MSWLQCYALISRMYGLQSQFDYFGGKTNCLLPLGIELQ